MEAAAYSKVTWRLIPFLFLCYIVAYLDRVNVGFAKLQMSADLNFSETIYGLGAGIFFIGYFFFEVPSNLILHRIGARVWIARIMITWGIISAMMMLVTTPGMFYTLRFFLGVAEAGFFPGIILYLTYWYPSHRRAEMTAIFMTAIAISGVVGGPVSGWIMQSLSGVNGWAGWQWLFLLEALPSVIVGIVVLFYLDNGIQAAQWLSEREKQILHYNIVQESRIKPSHSMREALIDKRVWLMSLIYFCFVMGLYGVSFWMPTLIEAMGVERPLDVGLLSALPYAAAAIGMIQISRSADKHRERRWHLAIPGFLGATGLIVSAFYASNIIISMTALTFGTLGIIATLPLFWSLPTALLGGTAAAAGIAFINSIGNLAGFASPYMVGWIKDLTRSTSMGMYSLAASLLVGSILVLTLPARTVNK